jgi:hypothetical protein
VDPICLVVAGVVRATLPQPEFTLTWEHSVQKTRWEERYRADREALTLVEARVQGSGAGMEPAPQAVLRGGWWAWQPGTRLSVLRLTRSEFTPDYTLCWRDRCAALGELVGTNAESAVVEVRPCAR